MQVAGGANALTAQVEVLPRQKWEERDGLREACVRAIGCARSLLCTIININSSAIAVQ